MLTNHHYGVKRNSNEGDGRSEIRVLTTKKNGFESLSISELLIARVVKGYPGIKTTSSIGKHLLSSFP